MDALTVDRIHFAFTATFHYLFPQLTMGLALLILVLKTLAIRTGDGHYDQAARFWGCIFGIDFEALRELSARPVSSRRWMYLSSVPRVWNGPPSLLSRSGQASASRAAMSSGSFRRTALQLSRVVSRAIASNVRCLPQSSRTREAVTARASRTQARARSLPRARRAGGVTGPSS